ncbi:hypothetical protein SH528x_004699 [Novipirellula sp. SH528]|uniref:hypothetical protein n=1 Tax=Novipirellula sp. SH528 TaxID=3454466 RepID=UPI003FA11E74
MSFRTNLTIIVLLLLWPQAGKKALAQSDLSEFRTWTDTSGRSVETRMVDRDDGKILLERRDGKRGSVRLVQLIQPQANTPKGTVDTVRRILSLPEVVAAAEKLRADNTTTQQRTQNYTVTSMAWQCVTETVCLNGRWVTRNVWRQIPVQEIRTKTYNIVLSLIDDEPLFKTPDDSRVGVGYAKVPLQGLLPKAAGGRASKVYDFSINSLPSNIRHAILNEDRLLEVQSAGYLTPQSNSLVEEKIRLVATIRNDDNEVDIVLLLLRRDKANGILLSDKTQLNKDAQTFADEIKTKL